MTQVWRLDDAVQTLVLASEDDALPCIVYWGAPLPEGEAETIAAAARRDITGGMLDVESPLSICPEAARSFPGQPGFSGRDASGTVLRPAFRLQIAACDGKAIQITARDDAAGLTYRAEIALDAETCVVTARASLGADAPISLDWLAAPVFPAPDLGDEMIDLSGRWIGEFQVNRTQWSPGIRMRDNRTGRTGHEHLPLLILPDPGTTNTQGQARAFHYGWSGGHRMIAEELPDGRRQVQFGHAGGTALTPGTEFETATLYTCLSDTGFNGCGVAFQRHLLDRIITWPKSSTPRPVHYNCWEAIYFDHSLTDLKAIANRAAELGAERFVLDDGWFKGRTDDRRALGDWVVDTGKYPDGLMPLIEHVIGLGMSFGIWFEPEMVNPDSDLYRAHPDWALGAPGQVTGRQQLVLDMGREEVREYLFDSIAAILREHPISYIKWDHNRVLPHADAAQTRGSYALLERLRAAFPEVEIESCSSGGGRIDFGIMAYCQRVWLSDSNDALERLRMQHEAAVLLPLAVTGSHVGPRTCHSSGRVLPMQFRAWVAAQRHMGFEMDPRELNPEEAEVLSRVTAWWKANRDWRQSADILRLDSADPAVIAEQQMARNGARFVVFAGQAVASAQIAPRPLRLTGLDPAAFYEITPVGIPPTPPGLTRGETALSKGPVRLSGQYLMRHGITLPWTFPQTIWVLEGRKL